jgi:hypothetical protein
MRIKIVAFVKEELPDLNGNKFENEVRQHKRVLYKG